MSYAFLAGMVLLCAAALAAAGEPREDPPRLVSDYDGGDVFWVAGGRKYPVHGMREPWVFNRAMVWLDEKDGVDGAVICHSAPTPLVLTGRRSVSRWYSAPGNDISDVDDLTSSLVKKSDVEFEHVSLPPFQFHIEQTPVAEVDVLRATHPWQLLICVKGRSGPPLYASGWQDRRSERLRIDLLDAYRRRGYSHRFAELQFCLAVRTPVGNEPAAMDFRLRLAGRDAVVASLPVVRTASRAAREGVPVNAVVLDAAGNRVTGEAVRVTASIGRHNIDLSPGPTGIWKGTFRDLPPGEHTATLSAVWRDGARTAGTTLDIRITDGRFIGYDPKLRLPTLDGRPIGPLSGSYRGAPMFRHIGTPRESLVQGQREWDAVKGDRHEGQHFNHGGPEYGFHFWESLTDAELEADYAYLQRCGWSLVHLCQGWWAWERFDAGGRIAPHGAERLFRLVSAAQRHGIRVLVALSHYPLGKAGAPWAQYLAAGYAREDYNKADSAFYRLFTGYLADFIAIFREDSGISSFTASGEGDVDCGRTFVNAVYDFVTSRDGNHLFMCEPHLNPRPYPRDVNYYRREGWRPVLGGMRTYMIDREPPEHIAVQLKLGAMGDIFLGEGVFWGFMDAPRQMQRYRQRVRTQVYTALAYRTPMQLSWEERVVEDERRVLEQVRQLVDWSRPFRTPRLALRVGTDLSVLVRYEQALSRLPLEYCFVLDDDAPPAGTLHVIDTRKPFAAPAFAAEGGSLPESLRAEMPLTLPQGYCASYSWGEDRRTLLALVRAVGESAGPVGLGLRNFAAGRLIYRVFDLETKTVISEGGFDTRADVGLTGRPHDVFVVVTGQ